MPNILYTLIIFPIEQLLELCYAITLHFTKSPGLSVIGLSIIVSTLILPIYIMAEKKQNAERNIQKQMKGELDNIKNVFKGDKRFMLISTLYRQNNYHPIYSISNSLDLFIQIPFFIAAYHFLHNLELLNGQKFKFLADLGAPDGLLGGINLLPILMTVINCVSGAIYLKGLQLKDKIQLYGLALIFLVLLYNSPAALVLYWTCNNIYNLIKNIVIKYRIKIFVYPVIIIIISCFILYILLSSHEIGKFRRFALAFFTCLIILLQYRKHIIAYWRNIDKITLIKKITLKNTDKIFAFSLVGIFLLIGFVIPSSLIASSVEEFSFIKPFSSPVPFIGITLLQSAGILLWLVCIYLLFSKHARLIMTFLFTIILGIFIVNVFCFNIDYSFMTTDLSFSNFHSIKLTYKIVNIFVLLFTSAVIVLLFLIKKEKILLALQIILIVSFSCFGITNIFKINKIFLKVNAEVSTTSDNINDFSKNYTLSKNGKNILIIMLDKAVSGYVPYIFNEKPELLDSFRGFTYYPNTISFGTITLHGLSGIFGGYYYTPLNRQNRKNQNYLDTLYESFQVLPRILAESNFKVYVYNMPFIDNSLFNKFKNITAGKNLDIFTPYYLDKVNTISMKNFYQTLYNNLIRFSFFKTFPIMFHKLIYDDGKYLSLFKTYNYTRETINSYTSLYFLSDITEIKSDNNNYADIFINELTHDPGFMQAPEYTPSNNITNYGNGLWAKEEYYHGNMASFLLLAKYFNFLKENSVYDNTRIIIVSDHGDEYHITSFPNSITFSDIDEYWRLEGSTALLLIKDFNADFELKTDNTFMTNADVPHIAIKDLTVAINPFTGIEMLVEKDNGVTITTNHVFIPEEFLREGIKPNQWLHVKENIFDPANWSKVNILN